MPTSDFDLSASDEDQPEYSFEDDAHAGVAPYLTLQTIDDATLARYAGPFVTPAIDAHAEHPSSFADVFRGEETRAQVAYVRRALASAVDEWWRTDTLPPDSLLRDGLQVLEAGYPLEESQRTLLARTALARGHGVLTALRHQTDPERVATLVHDAIMEGTLTPNGLRALLVDDALDAHWITALTVALQADLASPITALRAQSALNLISAAFWAGAPQTAPVDATLDTSQPHRVWVRIVIAVLLLLALSLLWYWRSRAADYGDVITVPAGAYLMSTERGALARQPLATFVIDRTEVTVGDYARCVASGLCKRASPEGDEASGDPSLANHPAAGITWEEAQGYCAGRAMRLPSAAEWEVAAGYAPATNRAWRFPWGETWEPALVIGGTENGYTATFPVGSRSPGGDSPLGAADMAGNVAEWTATSPAGAPDEALVKGGSFRDSRDAFTVSAASATPKSTVAPWLGFRCAATPDDAAPGNS